MHLHNYYRTKHSAVLKILREQLNWDGEWEVALSKISYHLMSQRSNSSFYLKNLSKTSESYYLEPGLYPSIKGIVESLNTLIQEEHNHSESCFTVELFYRTQKKMRFPLKMKELDLHSAVRNWDTFSEALLAMKLEC